MPPDLKSNGSSQPKMPASNSEASTYQLTPDRGLAWFRLQQPFGQERRPRLPPDDPVDREVLVLLIVLDRLFGGRAKVAVLDQDGKATPLIQHQLKVLHRRRASLRLYPLPQHRQTEGHLSVSHPPLLLL